MTVNATTLAQEILVRAQAANARLRENPFYARLLAGEVSRDEYAAWLVQLHHYVRHTVRGEHGLATAMASSAERDAAAAAIRDHALHEAEEEAGHDELLVLDLATLWGCSPDAARGRLEREPVAPAVVAWGGLVDVMLSRYPQGVVGVALALERLASLQSDEIRDALLVQRPFADLDDAIHFLAAHSAEVELAHGEAGQQRAALLNGPVARNAAFFYANAALSLYEGIAHFLAERFPMPELAPVGA